jgi:hypothetical protein
MSSGRRSLASKIKKETKRGKRKKGEDQEEQDDVDIKRDVQVEDEDEDEDEKMGLISTCPDVNNLYEYERKLYGGYDEKIENIKRCFAKMFRDKKRKRGVNDFYTEKNVKDFLFKIDSIHDFTKERGSKELKKDIIKSLKFEEDDEIDKKVIHDPDLETSIFFWFVMYVMRVPMKDEYESSLKKIDFRSSIQEYRNYTINENFTLDAGLKEYNIFEALLTSLATKEKVLEGMSKIKVNHDILTSWYNDISNKFKKTIKKDPEYYILYSLGKNLIYAYENFLLGDKIDITNVVNNIFEKYTKEVIATTKNINYNERLKKELETIDIKKIKLEGKLEQKYLEYILSNKLVADKKSFTSANYELAEKLKIPQGVKQNINKILTKNERFKVIAPQKFDANRTTGGGVKPNEILGIDGCENLDEKKSSDISSCSFSILDDICYFYSVNDDSNNVKYIFEFKDENSATKYPIRKVIIVNKDYLQSYKLNYEDIDRFKYNKTNRTLVCSNAPGVTELTQLYEIFINPKPKKKGDPQGYGFGNTEALKNILQIKRAGDYSQIWFCKQWNKSSNTPKLFFMSNDRQSATFCLLEGVPYIGQVNYYNVYFNPLGSDIEKDRKDIDITDPKLLANVIKQSLISSINEIMYFYDNTQSDEILECIEKYLEHIYKYHNKKVYNKFEIDMSIISDALITYINKQEERGQDYCKTEIGEIKKGFNKIEEDMKKYNNDTYPSTINKLYNKIIEDYFEEDSSYSLYNKCGSIASTLGINPLLCSQISEPEDKEEIAEIEDEISLLQFRYGLKRVNIPPELNQENIKEINNLGRGFNCRNLYNQLTTLYTDFDYFRDYEFSEYDIQVYKNNYNKLYSCLEINPEALAIFFPQGKYEESTFSDLQDIQREQIAFSFQDGITYYHIQPKIPTKINMKKYYNTNKVYLIDGKGALKIQGSNLKGDIQVVDRTPKLVSYTDGTEISYYKF